MAVISMKALLEAGVHFGHRTRRWNPKMQPFIFTERNGIHIIDLQQTIASLEAAYNLTRDAVAEGGLVLFVGTKKQAQENIATEAERCGMPYINQRWLGGTLTNWRTIRQRIDYLLSLEIRRDRGEFAHLPKKEALQMEREIVRLNRRLSGLKTMRRLPDVVFITDTRREAIAVKEANILSIPIVAMVDTNCDPDPIDYAIPSNDDAIRAIKLITSKIADAVVEGQQIQEAMQAEEEAEGELVLAEEEEMEKYLGPATLAKLRATSAAEEEEEEEAAAAAAGEGAYPGSRQQARAGSLARRAGEAEELEQDEREPISEEELEEAYSDEEYDYDDEEE
jgi:small subunit ribosomal protein S2